MLDTFNPAKFRQIAKGGEGFKDAVPEGYRDLLEIIRFEAEGGISCGRGLMQLGNVALETLVSGPQNLRDPIAYEFSERRNMYTAYGPDELTLDGSTQRPKKIIEFTDDETKRWHEYLDIGSSSDDVSRQAAVGGLLIMYVSMSGKMAGVSKYAADTGENLLLFDRARDVLLATPWVIATEVLPDITPDEVNSIFGLSTPDYQATIKRFVDKADGPLIGS